MSPKLACSTGLLLLTLVAYWPASSALWDYWVDPNSGGGHGFLVAAICLGLLWRARVAMADVPIQGSLPGCVLLLLCSIAWIIFFRSGIQDLQLLLLPVILLFALFATLGYRAARVLAFPIGYLGFALPAWGTLGDPLQELTTRVVGFVAPPMGLPVRLSGNLALLPNGTFEIARGCSGINFLVVGLAVAALLGELERAPVRRRAALLGAAALVALVANWIRVLAIVALGYATDMRHPLVTHGHLLFGWVLFALALIAFVRLASGRRAAYEAPPAAPAKVETHSNVAVSRCLAAVCALLAVPILAAAILPARDCVSGCSSAIDAPAGRAPWHGPTPVEASSWHPHFEGPHVQWHVAYQDSSGSAVEVIGIGYDEQAQGRELVNEGNSLLGDEELRVIGAAAVKIGDDGAYTEAVIEDRRGDRAVVWSVYDIDGRRFVVPLLSQLWYGVRSLAGRPYSALFAFRVACAPTCAAARTVLAHFSHDMSRDVFASVVRERAHIAGSKSV